MKSNLKLAGSLVLSILFTLSALNVSASDFRDGTKDGGGGDDQVEVWSRVSRTIAQNISNFPQFSKVSDQLKLLSKYKPKLVLVDQLVDCEGKAITVESQYAQACPGRILLLKRNWDTWLANDYIALAHAHRILHENLRVTYYTTPVVERDSLTEDENYETTNDILETTNLISNPECERKVEIELSDSHLINLTEEYDIGMRSYKETGVLEAMNSCKLGISLGSSMEQFSKDIRSCQKFAKYFTFYKKPKNGKVYKKEGLDTMMFVFSRQCVHTEKAN